MRLVPIVSLALALTAITADAQYVPVVASVRQTTEITLGDKTIKTEVKEGNYYRSSDGSYIYQWTHLNGAKSNLRSSLWDNKTATSYTLDYANHRAMFGSRGTPLTPDLSSANRAAIEARPEEVVNGISCRVEPARFGPPGKQNGGGRGWYSLENDLLVKNDITYPGSDGKTMVHDTYELYDIHLGQEPDANLFDLRKNFQVLVPQSQN